MGVETLPLQKRALGQIVAYFEYQSAKEINAINGGPVTRLWQRNYYEHIIRNQQALELTWLYIKSNPPNGKRITTTPPDTDLHNGLNYGDVPNRASRFFYS